MRNIVNKEVTKDDICYDYIIGELISKKEYNLQEVKQYRNFLDTTIKNNVIKIGDLYIAMLIKEDWSEDDINRLLISVFVEPLCGNTKYINNDYAKNSIIEAEYVFMAGFSHINFCKIISFVTCNIKTVFNEECPFIDAICAMKPYNAELLKDFNNIKNDIKFNIGMISIFKCIQYFKELGYKYVLLECNKDLIFYYQKLYFKVGTNPSNDYSKCFKHNNRHTILNIINESDRRAKNVNIKDIEYTMAYYGGEKEASLKEQLEFILFYMYFDIEKYYHKLYRCIEARFYNLFDAYEFKRIFGMPYTKDKSFVFSERFMEKILLYDNK